MVHATWGETFLEQELESIEPEELSIWYLGCNGFVVRSPETTLYIDPFFGDGDPPSFYRMIPVPLDPSNVTDCDAVLVTHEHLDHFHPDSYGPILEQTQADLYAPDSCFNAPQKDWNDFRAPTEKRCVVQPGDEFQIGDLTIHVRGGNDPDSVGEVSYIIEHESGTYYNAGDSRFSDEFYDIGNNFDIDIGSLVFGTHTNIFWSDDWDGGPETRDTQMYMTENDIIKAANALQLDRLVPCHFDMWKGGRGDPKVLHEHAASYEHPHTIDIVEVGDRLNIGRSGVIPLKSIRDH